MRIIFRRANRNDSFIPRPNLGEDREITSYSAIETTVWASCVFALYSNYLPIALSHREPQMKLLTEEKLSTVVCYFDTYLTIISV